MRTMEPDIRGTEGKERQDSLRLSGAEERRKVPALSRIFMTKAE